MRKLNSRQREVLQAIIEDIADNGQAPTIFELKQSLGLEYDTQVTRALRSLEAKRFIERDRYKHRGITVLRADESQA